MVTPNKKLRSFEESDEVLYREQPDPSNSLAGPKGQLAQLVLWDSLSPYPATSAIVLANLEDIAVYVLWTAIPAVNSTSDEAYRTDRADG